MKKKAKSLLDVFFSHLPIGGLGVILMVWAIVTPVAMADPPPVRVFAAISLSESLTEAAKAFEAQTHIPVQLNLGASGQLCAQIEQGAPADLFISAAHKQIEPLVSAGLIQLDAIVVIARNRLVLVCPKEAEFPNGGFQALVNSEVARIALGEPRTVPAGQYAVEVLKSLNLLDQIRDKLVYAANVRQVLDYVERAEVDAGIIYQSDAKTSNKIRVVATAQPNWHKPIEYPAAVLKASAHRAEAEQFLRWLAGPQGQQILMTHGFSEIEPTSRPGVESHGQ